MSVVSVAPGAGVSRTIAIPPPIAAIANIAIKPTAICPFFRFIVKYLLDFGNL